MKDATAHRTDILNADLESPFFKAAAKKGKITAALNRGVRNPTSMSAARNRLIQLAAAI